MVVHTLDRLTPAIVTIDGPAGSGKSTIGFMLAQRAGWLFFDSGIMYRAVTWAALDRGIPIGDEDAVSALAEVLDIDIHPPDAQHRDGRHATVLVEGADVTWHLRRPEVEQNVSVVSAYARVRGALSALQRRIGLLYGQGRGGNLADARGIVMVGRDIGTVVLPEAPLKIFLTASAEERARRRHQETLARGKPSDYAVVLADIQARDAFDSGRTLSPLRRADDAFAVDTTLHTPDEVVAQILALAARVTATA